MSNLKKIFGSTSLTMLLFVIRSNHCLPIDQKNLTYPNGELINTLIYTNFRRKYVNDQDYPEKKIYKISQACLTLTKKEGQCKQINECVHNNMHLNLNQFLNYTCIFNSTQLRICCSNESPSSSSLSLVDSLVVPLPAVANFYTEKGNSPGRDTKCEKFESPYFIFFLLFYLFSLEKTRTV